MIVRLSLIILALGLAGCTQPTTKATDVRSEVEAPVLVVNDAYTQPEFTVSIKVDDRHGIRDGQAVETGMKVDETEKRLSQKSYYKISSGQRIDQVLKTWAKSNGGDAFWEHSEHFYVQADAEFYGTLSEAVSSLFASLGEASKPLNVRIFKNAYIRIEGDNK